MPGRNSTSPGQAVGTPDSAFTGGGLATELGAPLVAGGDPLQALPGLTVAEGATCAACGAEIRPGWTARTTAAGALRHDTCP